jgi:hypothetical protein
VSFSSTSGITVLTGLTGGALGGVASIDAGGGWGAGCVGGTAAGAVTGSVLGEHAVSSATPTNGTSSMKWRRLVKFAIVGTFGKYSELLGSCIGMFGQPGTGGWDAFS